MTLTVGSELQREATDFVLFLCHPCPQLMQGRDLIFITPCDSKIIRKSSKIGNPPPPSSSPFLSLSECPEEVYDPRSLYERLQEQKDRKQQEYEEQFKFSKLQKTGVRGSPQGLFDARLPHAILFLTSRGIVII